jgi:hypothetical protein
MHFHPKCALSSRHSRLTLYSSSLGKIANATICSNSGAFCFGSLFQPGSLANTPAIFRPGLEVRFIDQVRGPHHCKLKLSFCLEVHIYVRTLEAFYER